jgi:hypothetical protein
VFLILILCRSWIENRVLAWTRRILFFVLHDTELPAIPGLDAIVSPGQAAFSITENIILSQRIRKRVS